MVNFRLPRHKHFTQDVASRYYSYLAADAMVGIHLSTSARFAASLMQMLAISS